MNCPRQPHPARHRPGRWRARAFSLPEFMVAAGIFAIVVGGVLSAHVFGLRMIQFAELSSQYSRDDQKLLRQLGEELAAAKAFKVGAGSANGFVEPAPDRAHTGNAVQVYPTTNSAQYIRYYLDTNKGELYRLTTQPAVLALMATNVVNHSVFSAEGALGQVLSNQTQGAVLSLQLRMTDAVRRAWGINSKYTNRLVQARFSARAAD